MRAAYAKVSDQPVIVSFAWLLAACYPCEWARNHPFQSLRRCSALGLCGTAFDGGYVFWSWWVVSCRVGAKGYVWRNGLRSQWTYPSSIGCTSRRVNLCLLAYSKLGATGKCFGSYFSTRHSYHYRVWLSHHHQFSDYWVRSGSGEIENHRPLRRQIRTPCRKLAILVGCNKTRSVFVEALGLLTTSVQWMPSKLWSSPVRRQRRLKS